MTYAQIIENAYDTYAEGEEHPSKEDFLAQIFEICTDDSGKDSGQEYLISKLIPVLECIAKSETFQYIEKSNDNYLNYLTIVNLSYFSNKLDFGTSIRGAWFTHDGIEICGINLATQKEINMFILDLIEWFKNAK